MNWEEKALEIWQEYRWGDIDANDMLEFVHRLRAEFERELAQEPVAWRYKHHHGYRDWDYSDACPKMVSTSIVVPLFTREAAQPVPQGMVLVRADVVEFLKGSAALDGMWFGEYPVNSSKMFWWRRYLPNKLDAAKGTPT